MFPGPANGMPSRERILDIIPGIAPMLHQPLLPMADLPGSPVPLDACVRLAGAL
jgi:hypothetical protein